MAVATADVDALLVPISPDSPAGPDLRYEAAFDRLQSLRRTANEEQNERARWTDLAEFAKGMLAQSKDLRAAVYLLEAWARLEGFRGATHGVSLVRRLIEDFWDSLHPGIEDEDEEPLGPRAGFMQWVCDGLPDILKKAPLSSVKPYGVLHYQVTQKTGDERKALLAEGWPSSDGFEKAIRASPLAFLERVLADVAAVQAEVAALGESCDTRFVERGQGVLSFHMVREALETAHWLVDGVVKSVKGEAAPTAGGAPGESAEGAVYASVEGAGEDQVWGQARALIMEGKTEGLRLGQQHLAAATSVRAMFLRQLQLSELCVQAGMHSLAFPLLDELGRIIDERKLVEWEEKSVLRRVWQGLGDCARALEFKPACVARGQEADKRVQALGEKPK
jgi:type VI secretion system protein ImpA